MDSLTKPGGWQKLAFTVVGALIGILTFFVQEIYRDTKKIGVMQNQITNLQNNKGWMKAQQLDINRLKAGYIKHHGDLPNH